MFLPTPSAPSCRPPGERPGSGGRLVVTAQPGVEAVGGRCVRQRLRRSVGARFRDRVGASARDRPRAGGIQGNGGQRAGVPGGARPRRRLSGRFPSLGAGRHSPQGAVRGSPPDAPRRFRPHVPARRAWSVRPPRPARHDRRRIDLDTGEGPVEVEGEAAAAGGHARLLQEGRPGRRGAGRVGVMRPSPANAAVRVRPRGKGELTGPRPVRTRPAATRCQPGCRVRASYASRAASTSSVCSRDHSVRAFRGARSVWPSAVISYSTRTGTSG